MIIQIANHLPNRARCGISTYAHNLYAEAKYFEGIKAGFNSLNKDKHDKNQNDTKISFSKLDLSPFDTNFNDLFKLLFKPVQIIHFQHEFGIWPGFGLGFIIYLIIFKVLNFFTLKKIVVTMHTVWNVEDVDKIFAHYSRNLQFLIKLYLNFNYWITTWISSKIIVLNLESVTLLQKYTAKKSKIVHLPHGLFRANKNSVPRQILEEEYNLNQSDSLIVMFGFTYPSKGFHLVLEALPEILKKVPQAKVIIAGSAPSDGGQNYIQKLETITKNLKLEKNVVFTGFLNDEDERLQAIFEYAKCFVYPYFERGGASGSVATVFDYEKPILVSNIKFFENFDFLPKFNEGDIEDLTVHLVQLLLETSGDDNSKQIKKYLKDMSTYFANHSMKTVFATQIKIFQHLLYDSASRKN